eukprot:gb/GECH01011682.1/.p1 GENE.gb/GECH01011682.1/~~gb/GECH01011682.1/.p1  ORF type:complete len:705 (+),score=157.54 gb/GECH01011682.1/:1-2115(+)
MKWLVLLCFISILGFTFAQNPKCDRFPDVYAAEIEITGDGWTGSFFEVYDREGDVDERIRISSLTHEGYFLTLLDFKNDEGYEIVPSGECYSFHPSENGQLENYFINPNTGYLYTTEALLNFDTMVYNETLSGTDTVRGINTEVCVAHLNEYNSNYNATWDAYFHWAVSDWRFSTNENQVPVAVILDGVIVNSTSERDAHIEYHFTDFVSANRIPDDVFKKPEQCPLATQRDVPTLGDNFLATAEYKFPSFNSTMMIKEALDYQNNRIALLTWFQGQETVAQVDLNDKEAYVWYENRTCTSMPIDNARQIGIVGKDGHLLHASDLFVISDRFNDTYWGETTVRDIPAHEWRATISPEQASEPLDVHMFFSKDGWDTSGHGGRQVVPLRARMFLASDEDKKTPIVDIDFIEFVLGVPDPAFFEKPDFCSSVDQDAVSLPTLPDDFSTSIDAVIANRGYTIGLQEYYDYTNNRLRFDTHRHNSSLIEIFKLDEGKMYTITNGTQCQESSFDPEQGPPISENGRLYRGRDLFLFASQNETYYGTKQVRGVTADHWRSHFTGDFRQAHASYDADFYFSTGDWKFAHGQERIPMRIRVQGMTRNKTTNREHNFNHYYEFTDYISGTPDPEHFALPDICQSHGFLSSDPGVQGAEVAGIAVGVGIIGVALGFVAGALAVYFYAVKRVGRSKSSTFREMDDMGTTSNNMHS